MTYHELKRAYETECPDAGLLLKELSGFDAAAYLSHMTEEVPEDLEKRFLEGIVKLKNHVPVQHILGKAPFFGRDFLVSEDVLIPRFDTEILVQCALYENRERIAESDPAKNNGMNVLDLCTGSGCIAVTLALEGNFSEIVASDISKKALEIAGENATLQGCSEKIRFVESDLFDAWYQGEKFDLIVSNPPYIATEVISTLDPEVKDHDPMLALDGGRDGLDFYRRIISEAPKYLTEKGKLMLEIGDEQAEAVKELLEENQFRNVRVLKDLTSRDRVVTGEIPSH